MITGRKPAISKSRKSIAQFKLREGHADWLPRHAPPRCRCMSFLIAWWRRRCPAFAISAEFLPVVSTGVGNYTIGYCRPDRLSLRSNWTRSSGTQGMDITIVTSAQNDDEEPYDLLKLMGMPFSEQRKVRPLKIYGQDRLD